MHKKNQGLVFNVARKNFKFGKREIGEGLPCFIIAEIGINHEGSFDECLKMVTAAAEAGADAVKLQTSDPDENYHPATQSYEIYKRAFFGPEETGKIFNFARSLGLEVFTTSGLKTLDWVEALNPSGYKISSGLFSHLLLIAETAKKGRPVLLSTGLSTYEDIDKAVKIFSDQRLDEYAILQCTSLYPCEEKKLNLSSIPYIVQKYAVIGGFSDHSISVDTPAYAVMCGAKIIEKHFSLNTNRKGFDHHISLNQSAFKEMVRLVRRAEILLGDPGKKLSDDLHSVRQSMERQIFSGNKIKKDSIVTRDDLLFLRSDPEKLAGLGAGDYMSIIGKTAKRNVNYLEPINISDVSDKN